MQCQSVSLTELLAANAISTNRLQGIDLSTVRYQIQSNLTGEDVLVSLQLTDPNSMKLVDSASTTVASDMGGPPLRRHGRMDDPDVRRGGPGGGPHYLNNRDAAFEY